MGGLMGIVNLSAIATERGDTLDTQSLPNIGLCV